MTLLSETNYAQCQSSSLSNRLCCCGSLEGRSFILLSTPISPRAFCSSVAERVPLLCSFHLPQFELWLCVWQRVCVPVKKSLHVLVAQRDLCAPVCVCCARACTHAGIAACAVLHNVCAPHAAGSWLIDHPTQSFLSTADHNTPPTLSTACTGNRVGIIEL